MKRDKIAGYEHDSISGKHTSVYEGDGGKGVNLPLPPPPAMAETNKRKTKNAQRKTNIGLTKYRNYQLFLLRVVVTVAMLVCLFDCLSATIPGSLLK